MQNKIWQTDLGGGLEPIVEKYTVGNDYLLDQELLKYDIAASTAHAEMLSSIGILTKNELERLKGSLVDLLEECQHGTFRIGRNQEDSHTAIEQYLIEKLGDIGKKIHTGRSRNDQSLVMMRLYLKEHLAQAVTQTGLVASTFADAAIGAGQTPMPGYTHMQKAMPTIVAMWLRSFADAFTDLKPLLEASLNILDQNPLGSAAGFGVSIALDRDMTTGALGFAKTQENPMYCGLSRGLFELIAVQSLNPLMVLAGKYAHDMLMFTTEEFDLFSLPKSFTSGSSIMPHKQNYDLFEVMRGTANTFSAHSTKLQSITSGMGSGYQRDLQLTKGVTLSAFSEAISTLELIAATVAALQVHEGKLEASITNEMHSVEEINKLVATGVPFRDAYVHIKKQLNK